jgi:hypothetical protein
MKASPIAGKRFSDPSELLKLALDNPRRRPDKRLAKRSQIRFALRVSSFDDGQAGPWKDAELRNLSSAGLSIQTIEDWPVDTIFLMEFPAKVGKNKRAPIVCRVAHRNERPDGSCLLGAEFIGPLRPEVEA